MGVIKELLADPDIFYAICAFVAIIVFISLINVIANSFSSGNRKHSSYIGDNKKSVRPNTPRYKDYVPHQKQKTLEERKERLSNNQSFSSDLFVGEKNVIPYDKSENTKPSNNEFIKDSKGNENEQPSQIQNSLNDDGTVRTEINFDSPIDNCPPKQSSKKYEYLETANNGRFRKLLPTDEKSFFRTWIENGTRLFEFYGNVDKALANINAIFDDVCEIEGKRNGASQIINKKPGVLDSNLSIEKKAIIKLL